MIRKVIDKAVTACENSKNEVSDHFVEVNKTIDMPKSATKDILDYELSRYACYLIVQKKVNKKKPPRCYQHQSGSRTSLGGCSNTLVSNIVSSPRT